MKEQRAEDQMSDNVFLARKVAEQYFQLQQKKVFNVVVGSYKVGDMVLYDPMEDSDAMVRLKVIVSMTVAPEESLETPLDFSDALLMISYGRDGTLSVPETELLRVCFTYMDLLYSKFGYFDFKDFKKALRVGLESWIKVATPSIVKVVDAEVKTVYPPEGQPLIKKAVDNEFKKEEFIAMLATRDFNDQFAKNYFVEKGLEVTEQAARYIASKVGALKENLLVPS